MNKNRHLPLFVKAWGNLIYAIGGTADGSCERLDLYLKKWENIAQHPQPYSIINSQAVNILDKYIYVVGNDTQKGLVSIWKLDIDT